jgi:hypothetical protein
MKFVLSKNPVVTLLCHFTQRPPEEFQCDGAMAYFRVSKKPEVWRPFYLPVNTIVAWYNFDKGFQAPYEIEIDPDNLYYTDWKKKGLCFPITKK